MCRFASAFLLLFTMLPVSAQDWPQWRGINRNATIDDPEIGRNLPDGPLPVDWSAPVGPGYSGPTVADGRVYLTDRQGENRNVRERVLCFDASSGDLRWEVSNPVAYTIGYHASGPRAAVTVDGDVAYAVGGMGLMQCLDAETGDVIWKRDLNADFESRMPIWGITAAPLVYEDLVIQVAAGSSDDCIVALDAATGQTRWTALDQRAGYSAPILIRQGNQDVVVCWTGESVSGLDPSDGRVFWSIEMLPRNMPIGVPTPVVQDHQLFVSSFYDGSMLIDLNPDRPDAETSWYRVGQDEKNTDALHAMISNPIIKGDHIYGFDSYGELRCLQLSTGDRVWEDLTVVPRARWATVHTIRNGDREFMLNDRGELLVVSLSPDGVKIHSRSQLLSPTKQQLSRRDGVVWAHPAIADGHIYARNDKVLVRASLR